MFILFDSFKGVKLKILNEFKMLKIDYIIVFNRNSWRFMFKKRVCVEAHYIETKKWFFGLCPECYLRILLHSNEEIKVGPKITTKFPCKNGYIQRQNDFFFTDHL